MSESLIVDPGISTGIPTTKSTGSDTNSVTLEWDNGANASTHFQIQVTKFGWRSNTNSSTEGGDGSLYVDGPDLFIRKVLTKRSEFSISVPEHDRIGDDGILERNSVVVVRIRAGRNTGSISSESRSEQSHSKSVNTDGFDSKISAAATTNGTGKTSMTWGEWNQLSVVVLPRALRRMGDAMNMNMGSGMADRNSTTSESPDLSSSLPPAPPAPPAPLSSSSSLLPKIWAAAIAYCQESLSISLDGSSSSSSSVSGSFFVQAYLIIPSPKGGEASTSGSIALASLIDMTRGSALRISSVDLGYCLTERVGMEALAKSLNSESPNIYSVVGESTATRTTTSSEGGNGSGLDYLTRIAVNNNEAQSQGFVALAHGLEWRSLLARERLLTLELGYNHAGTEGIVALAGALSHHACPALTSLNITGNQAGSVGITALAGALGAGGCKELKVLDFHDNRAGDDGVAALGCAFSEGHCAELRSLFMSGSSAGAAGIVSLSKALAAGACPKLEDLHINRNQAGEEGIRALFMALQQGGCPALLQLHINANKLPLKACVASSIFAMTPHIVPTTNA